MEDEKYSEKKLIDKLKPKSSLSDKVMCEELDKEIHSFKEENEVEIEIEVKDIENNESHDEFEVKVEPTINLNSIKDEKEENEYKKEKEENEYKKEKEEKEEKEDKKESKFVDVVKSYWNDMMNYFKK